MSPLKNKFARVAGSALTATALLAGMTPLTQSFASAAPASSDTFNAQAPDIYFNLMSPLFTNGKQAVSIASDELSLQSTPNIISIRANTAEGALDQIAAGLKAAIMQNGGPVNRIFFSGDALTNAIEAPLPNPACGDRIPNIPERNATFCEVNFTDILNTLLILQSENFPGHNADEPLARAIDTNGCDVFADIGLGRLPAQQISQLAAQLNMPVIASATEVAYSFPPFMTPTLDKGVFIAMLPDGGISYLPGPYVNTGENLSANEAWIQEGGFTQESIIEPVANYPFSLVSPVAVTQAAKRAPKIG